MPKKIFLKNIKLSLMNTIDKIVATTDKSTKTSIYPSISVTIDKCTNKEFNADKSGINERNILTIIIIKEKSHSISIKSLLY